MSASQRGCSSCTSHRAKCSGGAESRLFPCVAPRVSPSWGFLFLSLVFEFDHAGTRWKVKTGRHTGSSGLRLRAVGLVTAERGTVPLVWSDLNGRRSNKARPLPLQPS